MFLVVAVAGLSWAGVGLADVIFDSYPKYTGGGYGFSGPNCILTYTDYDEAQRFVVPSGSDYTLDHLVLALEHWIGNYRGVDVCLMSEAPGDTVPDVVLAYAPTFYVSGDDHVDVDVYIPDCPVLQADSTYWIACSTSGDAYFSWNMSTGTLGYRAFRTNGGPWGFQYRTISAWKVYATPVPVAVDVGPTPSVDLFLWNSPNPFNPATVIRFDLPEASRVKLAIYDIQGRLLRTLVDADLPQGDHKADWDGRNERGRNQASGVYFAVLRAGDRSVTLRLGLLR